MVPPADLLTTNESYSAGIGNLKEEEIYLNNMGEVKVYQAQCRFLTPYLNF